MMLSLEGWPTKAKEAPSLHEVRLAQLDTNPVFQNLGGDRLDLRISVGSTWFSFGLGIFVLFFIIIDSVVLWVSLSHNFFQHSVNFG